MELVLSPGRLGGGGPNTGTPFENQEVREWSHVDRLTGMLEHARIETGRWHTRHPAGSAQAYGKVIDSRERNSADGNVVQKARRSVEVFHSQAVGGRSVQVVRASQWSSSRITDSTSNSPVSPPTNETAAQFRNGNENEDAVSSSKLVSGRNALALPQDGDESLTKLSQVSRLCRQINAETALNRKRMTVQSPLTGNRLQKLRGTREYGVNNGSICSLPMNSVKSTSNEDLTKSIDAKKSTTEFTRDCTARRSLQIPKSSRSPSELANPKPNIDKTYNGLIIPDFERSPGIDVQIGNGDAEFGDDGCRSAGTSDRESDRREVKSYVLGIEECVADTAVALNSKFHCEELRENGKDLVVSDYLRPTPIFSKPKTQLLNTQIANKTNTTVVHLNNKTFSDRKMELQSLSNDKPTTGVQQCRVQSLASRFSRIMDHRFDQDRDAPPELPNSASSAKNQVANGPTSRPVDGPGGRDRGVYAALVENHVAPIEIPLQTRNGDHEASRAKLVKRVGFCKTEVHFAAESGKVNIVETDCKPPPSNRFRRRRRNSVVAKMPVTNKNLPLIHFGDTSYEKYIFGQSNVQADAPAFNTAERISCLPENIIVAKDKSPGDKDPDFFTMQLQRDKSDLRRLQDSEDFNIRDEWGARLDNTILQGGEAVKLIDDQDDEPIEPKNFERVDEAIAIDHTFKGHTTTVNLGADLLSKLQKHTNEGKCNTISTGIQLQFNTRLQKLRENIPTSNVIPSSVDVVKNCPAKIVIPLHENPVAAPVNLSTFSSKIPRPLVRAHQSATLKSTNLVMNFNRINNFQSIVQSTENNSIVSPSFKNGDNSLVLKELLSTLHNQNWSQFNGMCCKDSDVDNVNNNYSKGTSTLITLNTINSPTVWKNGITNGKTYPTRSVPLRLRHMNGPVDQRILDQKRFEDPKNGRENQLQYSSGSEQADEEVRSYMLGSKPIRHKKLAHTITLEDLIYKTEDVEHVLGASAVKETRDNDDCLGRVADHVKECFEAAWIGTDAIYLLLMANIRKPAARKLSTATQEHYNLEQDHVNGFSHVDELDIFNSCLPVEEICFEANRTVERTHAMDTKVNESNVVTSDNENNKVLMNFVTTHEPTIARVENIHSHEPKRESFTNSKLRIQSTQSQTKEKLSSATYRNSKQSYSSTSKKTSINHKTKDDCDNTTTNDLPSCLKDDTNATDPTYVNVFQNSKKSIPIYENFHAARKKSHNNKKYLKSNDQSQTELKTNPQATLRSVNGHSDTKASLSNTDGEEEHFKLLNGDTKLTTISENNYYRQRNSCGNKKIKQRSKKIARSPSSTSSIESIHRNFVDGMAKESEAKSLHKKSTRSSRLHRVTGDHEHGLTKLASEKYSSSDKKKNTTKQTSNSKLPCSNHTSDGAVRTRGLNDSTRSKKPEIVYQTAVFNMKNEKLAKSSRSKESKTPRYINDLICGSKPKRATEVRHVKGLVLSQQRIPHKITSPPNRHWK